MTSLVILMRCLLPTRHRKHQFFQLSSGCLMKFAKYNSHYPARMQLVLSMQRQQECAFDPPPDAFQVQPCPHASTIIQRVKTCLGMNFSDEASGQNVHLQATLHERRSRTAKQQILVRVDKFQAQLPHLPVTIVSPCDGEKRSSRRLQLRLLMLVLQHVRQLLMPAKHSSSMRR